MPTLPGSTSTIPATGIAALAEAAVAGERLAEVAGADDDDRPVVVEAELAAELVDQVLDVVADPAHAVGAEVAEVLAHLGGVDAGEVGELLRRQVDDAGVERLGEQAQVFGEPGDRRLRNPPSARTHCPEHTPLVREFTSQPPARHRGCSGTQRSA